MTIPFATTTVTVTANAEPEPGEGATATTRASGVRAHISSPAGRELPAPGGGSERLDAVLDADPIDGMTHGDTVVDATTGDSYRAAWVAERTGLGLDHTVAGLVRVNGRAAA